MNKLAIGNNKLNIRTFMCFGCVDWIVSDCITQVEYFDQIPGKLQQSSVQLISHECHCYIPKNLVLFYNGQNVRLH